MGDITDINEESLSLFTVLVPKLDIVVLGIGDKPNNFNQYRKIIDFSRKHKIPFEILPTESACSTFNFLTSEGRNVAGALIPPQIIENLTDEDELRTKLHYQNLYKTD